MKGLIEKDFLLIKSNVKLIVLMLFVFSIMAIQGQFDVSFVVPFIVIMIFMSTFSYDEYNKWDAYAITIPNGRKNIVKSKYIASLILIVVSIIITFLLNYIIGLVNSNLDLDKFISTLSGTAFATILVLSIMYPFIFKFGIEKGRIGMFVITFVIVGIVGLFSKYVKIDLPNNLITIFNNYWFIFLPIILLVMLLISYNVSKKIYMKKEF